MTEQKTDTKTDTKTAAKPENRPTQTLERAEVSPNQSLIKKLAQQYSIDPDRLMDTLKNTCFKQKDNAPPITHEQMAALLIVADSFDLNPFVRQIYAYPDKNNGIVPVVGVDGWAAMITRHPEFMGMTFDTGDGGVVELEESKPCPEAITCIIKRKRDGEIAEIAITEYLDECWRAPFKPQGKNYTISGPWQSHPKRMLRHKAMIQCARVAFGFTGIYDEDEAERIIEGETIREDQPEKAGSVVADIVDAEVTAA